MFESDRLLLSALILASISGIPGLFFNRRSLVAPWIAAMLMVTSGTVGLIGAVQCAAQCASGSDVMLVEYPLPLPDASFALSVDPLSAFFLAAIFLVSTLGSLYGLEYWKPTEHPDNARKLRLFYGLLTACLAIVVLAKNSVTFLFGWEGMAVSAFFLVATEDDRNDVRDAGWMYLAASHAGTLALFTMFALMYGATGHFDFLPLTSDQISPAFASTLFLLALGGFGLKAGLMPLHFWLPGAHAMAPSHVSAIMSGVLIKMGIYGLVRMTGLLPDPPLWWGSLVLALGTVSAVFGMVLALSQHDLKRLLAYSSIENIGIVAIGLGLALLGRSLHNPVWVILGLSGALLHVWNHCLFKSLLFLAAGTVIHATHTRKIDELGGMAKPMPWTAAAFLVGASSACGLPPFNGFVSEFLIYLGLFHTLGLPGEPALPAAAFAIPALALSGAAAIACFVKAYGIVFLGVPRKPLAHRPHDPHWPMRLPLVVLSVIAISLGILTASVAPRLNGICAKWSGLSWDASIAASTLGPLVPLGWALIGLLGSLLFVFCWLRWKISTHPYAEHDTWGCGYLAPTPRLQYTGTSLTQFLVSLFGWSIQPVEIRPRIRELFPVQAAYWSEVPEIVLDRVVSPVFDALARRLLWFRLIQQGSVQIYLLYIVAMLVVLFTVF